MSGKSRRMGRLFPHKDGKAIITPIDHGLWYGPMQGIENPLEVGRQVIPASDGLLITPGFARAISQILPSDRALALRVGTSTELSPVQDYESLFVNVETALRLDADAVVHTLYLGGERDEQAIRDLGAILDSAGRYDLPVIAEFLPASEGWTAEHVARWARLGFEMGADVIKTVYTGDPESFRRVVAGCPIPILMAGGPALGSSADLLRAIHGSIQAGGAGIAIGRRVWQSSDPARLLAAICRLHGEAGIEEALSMV
jgi:DhnA family fructose-bisphosphate aldolase class Ia